MKSKKGFTLIELLVVTSIISLLSSIMLGPISEARAEARDTKKIQEINQVRIAMELYKNTNDSYPIGTGSDEITNFNEAYNENSPEYQSAMGQLVSDSFLIDIPSSPNGEDYFYLVDNSGDGVFGAVLESESAITDNGGCYFTDRNYSCLIGGFSRDALVSEGASCSEGDCSSVAVGEEGGDGVCTNHSECASGRCSSTTGTCVPFFSDIGDSCTTDSDCEGYCAPISLSSNSGGYSGNVCTNGLSGSYCENSDDCRGNTCTQIWGGNTRGWYGSCEGEIIPADNGATCTEHNECISNSCNKLTNTCVAEFTDIGNSCSGGCQSGYCGEIGSADVCTAGEPGDGCDGVGDCRSGVCPTTWGGRSRGHYGFCE